MNSDSYGGMHMYGNPLHVMKLLWQQQERPCPFVNLQVSRHKHDKGNTDYSAFELELLDIDGSTTDGASRCNQDHAPLAPAYNLRSYNKEAQIKSKPGDQTSTSTFATTHTLPDVVLVHIFSYLGVKDKCNLTRVCKQWQRAMKNPRLWKIVQTSPAEPSHLLPYLKSYIGNSLIFFSPCSMTTEGLQYLQKRCPNLKALWLLNHDLSKLKLTHMPCPSLLRSVSLVPNQTSRLSQSKWWTIFTPEKFPNLDFLYIARSDYADDVLQQVSLLTTLTGLRMEDCNGVIATSTFVGMAEKLTNLIFLSLIGCHSVKIEYLAPISRNLRKLQQLRLNRVWSLNPEEDLSPLISLLDLTRLHIQNGIDMDVAQVHQVSSSCATTIHMFSKLDSLILSGFGQFHEAVLVYMTAQSVQSVYKEMKVDILVDDEEEKEEKDHRIKCVYKAH